MIKKWSPVLTNFKIKKRERKDGKFMKFYTILKHINKMGFESFDDFIAMLDDPKEMSKKKNMAMIVKFTRYIASISKRHAKVSKAYRDTRDAEIKIKEEALYKKSPHSCEECSRFVINSTDVSNSTFRCGYYRFSIDDPKKLHKCSGFRRADK